MQIELIAQADENAAIRFVVDMLKRDWLTATDWQSTYITLDMLRADAARSIIGYMFLVPMGDEHGTRGIAYIGNATFTDAWKQAVTQWQERAA